MSGLQELLDERAIRDGLARFARAIDSRDWPALADAFAGDLSFNYGAGGLQHGIAALEAQMRRFIEPCGPTQHLIGSIIVEVDGDNATSRAYVQARHQRPDDPAGAVFDSSGEYVDRWERRREGWRIVHRDALWQVHSGDPAILAAGSDGLG